MEFYNEPLKRRYLESIDNEGTQILIRYIFSASKSAEENLEMDLFDFPINYIEEVMNNLPTKSPVTSRANVSLIRSYINWAIVHGYRENNLNPIDTLSKNWHLNFVDENIKQFISKQELDEIVKGLVNYQDKIIPVLLFNGIYGTESSEIRNISIQDVRNIKDNKLRVVDDKKGERYVEIDDSVIDLLFRAYDEKEYQNRNGIAEGRLRTSPLIDSDYIAKKLKRGRANVNYNEPIAQTTVIKRVDLIKDFFDLPDLTPKSINRSGMIYLASKLIKGKEELTQEDFQIIGEKFNLSKMNNNGYEYYNVYYLGNYINRDNIEKLYGKIE